MGELDRVLGGGLVEGSVVLISGEPGIGKSTILLQISAHLSEQRRVLYVTGEESGGQLKLRAKRLGVDGRNLYILTETSIEKIIAEMDKIKPDIVIIDSIQTIYSDKVASAPASIAQVRESTLAFINKAKAAGAEMIMTTEKDAVRMPRLDRRDIPILFLRVQIDILSGQENFDQCISRICFI